MFSFKSAEVSEIQPALPGTVGEWLAVTALQEIHSKPVDVTFSLMAGALDVSERLKFGPRVSFR